MKVVSFALASLFLCATSTMAQDPSCSSAVIENAQASTDILWPPNGKFRAVTVSLPDGYTVELTGVRQDEDPGAGPQRKNFIEQIFDAFALFFNNFFRGFGNLFGFGNGGRGGNTSSDGDGDSCPGNSCNNPGKGGENGNGKGKDGRALRSSIDYEKVDLKRLLQGNDLDDEDYGDDYDNIKVTPIDAGLDPDDKTKAYLRSERLGNGDGRIYKLDFIVTYGEDAEGNELKCTGSVDVCVPKSRGTGNNKNRCVESPTLYPSFSR